MGIGKREIERDLAGCSVAMIMMMTTMLKVIEVHLAFVFCSLLLLRALH